MYTSELSLDERVAITIDLLKDTIKCQESKMKIADKRGNDADYIKAYELSSFCEQIKDILDGNYELESYCKEFIEREQSYYKD